MKPDDYLIRELPEQKPRVETGPTKFGDDCPGVFIRGDNAFYYAVHLRRLLGKLSPNQSLIDMEPEDALQGLTGIKPEDALTIGVLVSLAKDLESCKV